MGLIPNPMAMAFCFPIFAFYASLSPTPIPNPPFPSIPTFRNWVSPHFSIFLESHSLSRFTFLLTVPISSKFSLFFLHSPICILRWNGSRENVIDCNFSDLHLSLGKNCRLLIVIMGLHQCFSR